VSIGVYKTPAQTHVVHTGFMPAGHTRPPGFEEYFFSFAGSSFGHACESRD
jgi:hypothetical protein